MFIVLEGIDGCGKSTQARLLARAIEERTGAPALHLHEPGGTPLGEVLRKVILQPDSGVEIHARTEALLYSAARAELVHSVLGPALKAGKHVVCERYYYSTVAYQGYGLGQDTGPLQGLSAYAIAGIRPDRVLLLDLPPNEGFRRVGKNLDRIEARGVAYLEKVRDGYLLLSRREPERFRVVDAGGSIEQVQERIRAAITDVLP
jgi:dTMP kinase